MHAKSIYRALPKSGHTPGTLFMMSDGDFRHSHPLFTGGYELVTRGALNGVKKLDRVVGYVGCVYEGHDGRRYLVFHDWSAKELTP